MAAVAHDQSRVALAAELNELLVNLKIVNYIWGTKTSELDHMPMFFQDTPPKKNLPGV